MKLANINRLDDILSLGREELVCEGIISDLIGSKVSQFQSWVSGHDKEVERLGLSDFIKAAKTLDVSLIDDSPESNEWWLSLINAIAKKYGGYITPKQRAEIIDKARTKADLIVNKDLEDVKSRFAALTKHNRRNAEVDEIFNRLFGIKRKPNRRHYTEGKIQESLGQSIASALDMFDPKKRIKRGAAMIRASNNARIAAMVIPYVAKQFHEKRRFRTKKPKIPSTPLTRKYEMAMYINKCMVDSSKTKYRDKPEKYWLQRINAKAKRMGMRIDIPHLPTKPYPTDFNEFKRKYGPEQ
jgi:hypothetical protein